MGTASQLEELAMQLDQALGFNAIGNQKCNLAPWIPVSPVARESDNEGDMFTSGCRSAGQRLGHRLGHFRDAQLSGYLVC